MQKVRRLYDRRSAVGMAPALTGFAGPHGILANELPLLARMRKQRYDGGLLGCQPGWRPGNHVRGDGETGVCGTFDVKAGN